MFTQMSLEPPFRNSLLIDEGLNWHWCAWGNLDEDCEHCPAPFNFQPERIHLKCLKTKPLSSPYPFRMSKAQLTYFPREIFVHMLSLHLEQTHLPKGIVLDILCMQSQVPLITLFLYKKRMELVLSTFRRWQTLTSMQEFN